MKKVINSPFRWTGSKKKLLNEMVSSFDKGKTVYIEPFLGSGVVMLNVINNQLYSNYFVNDVNQNIIDFYLNIKNNLDTLAKEIECIVNKYNNAEFKEKFYYETRMKFNESDESTEKKSAMFWFLMKAGYNGVYRVNSHNKFNVPFGKKEKIVFSYEQFAYISGLIQGVHFYCLSYEDFLFEVLHDIENKDCFIYCDPPYLPETPSTLHHVLYTKEKFLHRDFIEKLYDFQRIKKVSIMISMSDSAYANLLYGAGFKSLPLAEIVRTVNPKKIIKSKEIAYLNYDIELDSDK